MTVRKYFQAFLRCSLFLLTAHLWGPFVYLSSICTSKRLHDMYMILITCPYLVFNSYYHEIHPHKEISHSQIGQKAGLNWMVVTPDETPCYHCQVTNNSQDTQQPDTPSRTRGIDHAIATRQGVTLQLWILTAYILRVLRSVTTQGETVHSPWKRWNTTHFFIKKITKASKLLWFLTSRKSLKYM